MWRMIERCIGWYLDRKPDEKFVQFVFWIVTSRIKGKSPDQSLKLLFMLDQLLYGAQGQMAIAYGGGIHTKHRHIKYHDFFTSRVGKSDHVIDIGCGIGAVAFDIAKVANHVLGIDINEDSIEIARQKYQHPNLEFRVGDALEALPDQSCTVVIISNVLEHLPGRPFFLRRVNETLKPVRILIRVPLFERDWRVPLRKELGVEWRLDETHEIEYTLESFTEEIFEAGLKTDYLEVRWGEIWAEVS